MEIWLSLVSRRSGLGESTRPCDGTGNIFTGSSASVYD